MWFAERNRSYFLLHPDHLPMFLPRPTRTRARRSPPWIGTLVACIQLHRAPRDPTFRVGILDELLDEKEFSELQRYLGGRKWELQVLKSWNRVDLARAPVALASWNVAGYLMELSGRLDYDLSFSAVGCVEPIEHQQLPGDCDAQGPIDYLVAD